MAADKRKPKKKAKRRDDAGGQGQGFRELRPRAGRSRWRPIYRRVNPSTFVIFAVAPEAEIDSRGYGVAVARAVERLAQLKVD